jgi:hypothetical protein
VSFAGGGQIFGGGSEMMLPSVVLCGAVPGVLLDTGSKEVNHSDKEGRRQTKRREWGKVRFPLIPS